METIYPTIDNISPGSDAFAGCLRACNHWGGMKTVLYHLASTGSLELHPGEGPARIRNELADAIAIAERDHHDDAYYLRAFAEWVAEHDIDGEWADMPTWL
jgi:hypothetical protein